MKNKLFIVSKRVLTWQEGPGKSTVLLSATDFLQLAWYQQAGRWQKAAESRKYIDVGGKWSRYFTQTLDKIKSWTFLQFSSTLSEPILQWKGRESAVNTTPDGNTYPG